jgi:hypothetical protein
MSKHLNETWRAEALMLNRFELPSPTACTPEAQRQTQEVVA